VARWAPPRGCPRFNQCASPKCALQPSARRPPAGLVREPAPRRWSLPCARFGLEREKGLRPMSHHLRTAVLAALTLLVAVGLPRSQLPPAARAQAPAAQAQEATGSILLTVFLRHDQSKTLGEINERLKLNGYFQKFPPAGIDVVSWYVMMGIGQVVT